MTDAQANSDNAEQIEYWNGQAGQDWVERNQQLDKTLKSIGEQAIASAAVQVGETVLDIGCGCADTSFSLLEKTGPDGRVLGVDISGPMLKLAAARASQLPTDLQHAIAFEQADASDYPFEKQSFDLLFSRFGVMFFANPGAAFANMRKALKPGGRIVFICWAPVKQNQWITLPMGAALQHLPRPEPMPPNAPGPFGLSDPEFVKRVLGEAGFDQIEIASFQPVMRFGHGIACDKVADFFIEASPVSGLLSDAPTEQLGTVREAIAEAIMPHYDGETINLDASCWIVTASNS
jgi:SAM-dependent methyltransferase